MYDANGNQKEMKQEFQQAHPIVVMNLTTTTAVLVITTIYMKVKDYH
jgi:hypothetical protein